MTCVGFDTGTYNLVCCTRDASGNFVNKREVNAFLEMPISENRFVFNMMKQAGVPLIERKDTGVAYALGEAAVDMAYTMNHIELRRPMKDGCLNPSERNAQQILGAMIHGMIGELEKDNTTLYYSVPANAINEDTDAEFHSKVVERIFRDFEDSEGRKLNPHPINEGLALIYAELANKQWTGLGVSCGAGMVNICFSIFGNPVFSFALVNSGDWIDKQAAKATGESPTYINKEKLKLDLTKEPESLIQRAIKTEYEIMIQKTVTGIKKGLEDSKNKIRTDGAIDIVIAGGTAMPVGFENLVKEVIAKSHLPIEIGKIIKPSDPLFSVARGCLLAAEASEIG